MRKLFNDYKGLFILATLWLVVLAAVVLVPECATLFGIPFDISDVCMMSLLSGLTLKQSVPVSDEEALLEAQAWGYDDVESYFNAMSDAYDDEVNAQLEADLNAEIVATSFPDEFHHNL